MVSFTQPSVQPEARVRNTGERSWRPRGTHSKALYDRSKVVGLCGPAGTGKSRTWLEKIHLMCEKYPGLRTLVCRKTRESLTEAALFTLEEEVIPEGHPVLDGARRSHKSQYNYPNGSIIVVCGLDKPQKIMSTQYDIIYVQEFIECDQDDLEMLKTRLRNFNIEYQQILFDTNPDKETHWVKVASDNGEFVMYNTFHQDNPVYWEEAPPDVQKRAAGRPAGLRTEYDWPDVAPDGRIGRWTPEGREYVLGTLASIKGARGKRLYGGKWASSEGAVYEEEWSDEENGNVLPAGYMPPAYWRRLWCVDFGYTAPMSVQKWAFDSDNRMVMYQEVYHSRRLVRENAKEALESSGWSYSPETGHVAIVDNPDPLPEYVVADWDAEGRAQFEEHTGLRVVAAYKGIENGIQACKMRLQPAPDGIRRCFFVKGAVIKRDKALKDAGKPQCTLEEIGGYVWPEGLSTAAAQRRGEKPVQVDDHGMDTWRYMVCNVDNANDNWKATDVVNAASASPQMTGVMGIAGVPIVKRSDMERRFDKAGDNNSRAKGRPGSRRVQWPPSKWRQSRK